MKLKYFSITLLLLILGSCAPQYKAVSPEVISKMDADLKSGNCQLSDDVSHLYHWVSDFSQLVAFYNSSQWHSLAFSVMQIGYENDIAYYFLGSAAQGLGYPDAALKYYNASKALYSDNHISHHCRESAEGCGDLRLDVLLPTRINSLQQKHLASRATPTPTKSAAAKSTAPVSKKSSLIQNNFSYDLDGGKPLTKDIINNLSYKIHIHKAQFDENPQYELVQFSKGLYTDEEASIPAWGLGKISGDTNGAALVLSSFSGGNSYEFHICVITPDGNRYHIHQALLNLYAVRITHLTIKNEKILVSLLYRGPGEPTCCPTQKGTLEFQLVNDHIELTKSISFPRVW